METIFDKAFDQIVTYKEDKLAGNINSIPVPFPRLSKHFPGWERGRYTIITANSGVGKTKIAKFMLVTSIMKFAEDNPKMDIHIRWYALEEGELDFAHSFIATILAVKFGIKMSSVKLKSLGEYTLTDDIQKAVDDARHILNKFMKNVTVIDFILNPYGIWKDVRDFAASRGEFYHEGRDAVTGVAFKNKMEVGKGFNKYYPNNPKEFVFICTDHISLLHREKNHKSDHEAIGKFSTDYCLGNMVKKLNYAVCNIQQQVSDKEKMQYTFKGSAVEAKVEPSLDGLGENKTTQRDADLVLGVFAPTRYGIDVYEGYKIAPADGGFGDQFRSIKFLKDRHYGLANSKINLFFNGAINFFVELPKAEDIAPQDYLNFKNKY